MKSYRVPNFNKVDTTRYIEGDIFYTDKEVGILINGKIKKLTASTPNMKDYVKKDEVKSMIDDALKGGNANE